MNGFLSVLSGFVVGALVGFGATILIVLFKESIQRRRQNACRERREKLVRQWKDCFTRLAEGKIETLELAAQGKHEQAERHRRRMASEMDQFRACSLAIMREYAEEGRLEPPEDADDDEWPPEWPTGAASDDE